ncbi:winged helix-turn-helix domain-containing protein [Paenibacillus sp. 481]|uniref:winged helix-turn-helix domain-containing protein n=1 Tax=Paenibacillus sp. 481 TaxID=2835869 RepID=UPI001E39177B|nr:helix-turn-helix domain-containing protein [Paenibacillus sp. 481]UHA74986.1 winged helix-turn-helix domain-containing protein [Paenibacillus sp. 481]
MKEVVVMAGRHEFITLEKDCYIDIDRSLIIKNEQQIPLSRLELRLLQRLARNMGEVVPFNTLIAHVWCSDEECGYFDIQKLHVFIYRLRSKIEDNPQQPKYIVRARKLGYVLNQK